ncbi:MAG: multiheme c-type cytochrome, partial [Deltaproteobacteria bacterium]
NGYLQVSELVLSRLSHCRTTPLNIEALLIAVFSCAGIVPVFVARGGAKIATRTSVAVTVVLWLGLTILIISTAFFWTEPPVDREMAVTNRPIQAPFSNYVGSEACRSCHPHNHATWYDSYHRTMTQVADEKSVIGNFDNVELHGKDLKVVLFRQGNEFLVEMASEILQRTEVFPVVMTTGSHHRQAYWLASSKYSGDLIILPCMFLKDEQKWIPRHSGYINPMCLQARPELSILVHDSGRWGNACMRCHATHGRFDPAGGADNAARRRVLETQAVEFGISCEACHGPGLDHVRLNRNPIRRYEQRLALAPVHRGH